MITELTTSSGRNGGASSLPSTSDKAEGSKSKLNLAELAAPVLNDLQLLNDNLQKVSSFCSGDFAALFRILCLIMAMRFWVLTLFRLQRNVA